MLLPMSFPFTDAGLADGIRRFSDALSRPVVVYIKASDLHRAVHLGRLAEEGRIAAVKYAAVRHDPSQDPYLSALLKAVDPRLMVGGIGERPAIATLPRIRAAEFHVRLGMHRATRFHAAVALAAEGRLQQAERVRAATCPWRTAAMPSVRSGCCMMP